jgi:15-cis-phytoene desaturase
MAFLDGAPPERLCQPMVDYFTAKGGQLTMGARLKEIELNEDGTVKAIQLVNGDKVCVSVCVCVVVGGATEETAGGSTC